MNNFIKVVATTIAVVTCIIVITSCYVNAGNDLGTVDQSQPITTIESTYPDVNIPPLDDELVQEEKPSENDETNVTIDFFDVPEIQIDYYDVTEEEREMLARLTYLEAGICSQECKEHIVSVIFNRLDSNRWRKDMNGDGAITLYDIVYYPNAFSPAYLIDKTTPTQSCYDAVDYVIENGPTVPTYVRYFRMDYDFNWDDYVNYCIIDDTYFGYFTTWEKGAW